MSNYTFYFDESMHDRKIGLSDDGSFNFLKDAAFDTYVGAFWGVRTKSLSRVIGLISEFESKQKARYGLNDKQELKTTTINKKQFKYGFRSFKTDSYHFYSDLFDLLHDIKPVLQITMISKMELYMRHLFSNYNMDMSFVVPDLFYYSITKFMLTYGTEQLRNELLSISSKEDMNHYIGSIILELKSIIVKTERIPRKQREVQAFEQLVLVLECIDEASGVLQKKYPFEYECSFEGLCALLKEKRISIATTEVIIDEEINTFNAAQAYNFENSENKKSHELVELRMADWIAGFVGRMVYSLNMDDCFREHVEALSELNDKDIVSKHLLSKEWFDITNEDFELYHKAYQVFILDHDERWASMTGAFFDSTALFYSLLRYFGSYNDYESYSAISTEKHPDYFNSCACEELDRGYLERQ